MDSIRLNALVNKERNAVLFVESDSDFIDVLFSFLTIPIGRTIRLARDHSLPVGIGCVQNLYGSVEKIDNEEFRFVSKTMLLLPRDVAESDCQKLRLKIGTQNPSLGFSTKNPSFGFSTQSAPFGFSTQNPSFGYYMCPQRKVLSYYQCNPCPCCAGSVYEKILLSSDGGKVGGVFVKPRARFIVTDDLCVMPSSAASFSLYTKLGVTNENTNELTLDLGVEEAINLLVSTFVSKTPLTETLLKQKPVPETSNLMSFATEVFGDTSNEKGVVNTSVKLMVSKSKKMVCYAKAGEDFGSLDHLYGSVLDLDEHWFNSNHHKQMLQNPKLFPGFCYKNDLLGIDEASYYYVGNGLTTDGSAIPSIKSSESTQFQVIDIKTLSELKENFSSYTSYDKNASAHGYFEGPGNFIVTDNLVVSPLSSIFELSVLKELKVPFSDIEERIVHVGKKEAVQLLVASFLCNNSVLTNVFIK